MSRDPEFRAKDKKTHKMTRDWLVEVNQTTGEESRLSQRGQDFQLKQAPAGGHSIPSDTHQTNRSREAPASVLGKPATVDTAPREGAESPTCLLLTSDAADDRTRVDHGVRRTV